MNGQPARSASTPLRGSRIFGQGSGGPRHRPIPPAPRGGQHARELANQFEEVKTQIAGLYEQWEELAAATEYLLAV
jgi:hypothetical protein